MKKILLSAVAVLAFSFANAQEIVSSKGENYLPKEGDWSIGFKANNVLNFVGNAFNSSANTIGNFESNGIGFVGKRFTTDNTADRYIADFSVNFEKIKDVDATAPNFSLLAGYGKEWRKGTTRLQGFYGADAFLQFGSTTNNIEENGVPKEVKKFGFGIGAQGFVGAEYFIFPKVALGAQYTYGVTLGYESTKKNNKINNTSTDSNKFSFKLGGVGTTSVLLNLYF